MERRNRVEILFHEAIALEPSARTSFLKEACSGEPALLEEVVSLISAHEQSWTFIDAPFNYAQDQANDELSQSLIGTSIGRYQVVRLIKRSGMGEVYLARDTHLPREVALKLLPLMFTGDESRLRRFILEAEAASSLNHPNILTIHEIGHIHDVHYIATEFVDGQTLRERLSDGRLELDEALEIAVGVTNALVASHAAGIVHRDIKPENIMIRRDGYVKVLDFGLAKLTERPDVRVDVNSPNISSMDTDPGTFMGTVGYLSPEQAKSLEVDTRSDLFSLGVVLYEMIAGENPFNRTSFSTVIEAILTTEPAPLASFAPKTPASLQRVVTKALSKDKLSRYQRTEDLLADLKAVQAQLQQAMPRKLTPRERWWRIAVYAAAIIALAVVVVSILKTFRPAGNPTQTNEAFSRVSFTEIQSWKRERNEGTIDARFSHDGRFIAFTMMRNQHESIWVKQALKDAEPRQLTTGSTNSLWPIWSPDDQEIAFVSTREGKTGVWTISANGGTETFLSPIEGSTVRTRSWSKDGRTIYYEINGNLFSLDLALRTNTQLTQFAAKTYRAHFSVAPAEDRICYMEIKNGQTDIWVASLRGEAPFNLTDDAVDDRWPTWHPDGKRIVFTSNRGGAFQVCVASVESASTAQITKGIDHHLISDVSRDGSKLLDVNSRDDAAIFAVDVHTGRESELASGIGLKLWPEISPNGGILFQSAKNVATLMSSTIIVRPTANEGPIVPIAANGFAPIWSPDGSQVAFMRLDSDRVEIFTVRATGDGERRLTTGGVVSSDFRMLPTLKFGRSICWSEEGEKIIYSSRKSGVSNLWAVSVDGSKDTQVSTNTDPTLSIYEPVCGPDGRIAFATESRRGSSRSWALWVREDDETKLIFESKSLLRPIGWPENGGGLTAASAEKDFQGKPAAVIMISCSNDGQCRKMEPLAATYLWSVELAPDSRTIAFVSSRDGSDNVWYADTMGGNTQRLTSNNEPRIFFPGLNWSPNGKSIYFGKETSVGLINMIDNFE